MSLLSGAGGGGTYHDVGAVVLDVDLDEGCFSEGSRLGALDSVIGDDTFLAGLALLADDDVVNFENRGVGAGAAGEEMMSGCFGGALGSCLDFLRRKDIAESSNKSGIGSQVKRSKRGCLEAGEHVKHTGDDSNKWKLNCRHKTVPDGCRDRSQTLPRSPCSMSSSKNLVSSLSNRTVQVFFRPATIS